MQGVGFRVQGSGFRVQGSGNPTHPVSSGTPPTPRPPFFFFFFITLGLELSDAKVYEP